MTDALIRLAKESSEGKGDEIFGEIKRTHYKILEDLKIENEILENDLAELSSLSIQIQ